MTSDHIRIRGARQNNLKALDLDLPIGELIVVTGVSGSGKSSLAFDTVYAEGQRRYVETFSSYARQFLDRMDRPAVDAVEGIPPAIAIDQTNPVRTSRSTVGTMTELNDHLKLLWARAARLHCRGCARAVRRDSPESVVETLLEIGREPPEPPRAAVTFAVEVPDSMQQGEVEALLARQGFTRVRSRAGGRLEVTQDRVRLDARNASRLTEAIESALRFGRGRIAVHLIDAPGTDLRFSADLHCAHCDIHYRDPVPSLFSFNSPVGACETCRGFGRTMGIDEGLVVPDEARSLADGAVKPWQTASYGECQRDLLAFARRRGVPTNRAWRDLAERHRRWVMDGEGSWDDGKWYGVHRFFDWLETKSYRMHIRVLLSKYRAYHRCPDCAGARLRREALDWRLGTLGEADRVVAREQRLRPGGGTGEADGMAAVPGLTIHDLMLAPIDGAHAFFEQLTLPRPLDEATELLLGEVRSRLAYLVEVGLGYLTLDRQSRTLSGGEVQRINLTTALGTSLTSTLFVLDEPSIGLHARDAGRVVRVLERLRDAGNTLLVVEHHEQIIRAADRIVDLGPGPGERGGHIVFSGTPAQLARRRGSLTGQYLSGRRSVLEGLAPRRPPPDASTLWLEVLGASQNNLRNIDVRIPLERMVCVSGVSGSGKSTLIETVLHRALTKLAGRPTEAPGTHRAVRGHEHLTEVVLVDQSPIGKTARSNPASYVGAFDAIRKAFATQPLARERGYKPGTFSFNSGTGRCPACSGSGFEHVEMQFLSDVYLRCPDCNGSRYRAEVLEVEIVGERGGGRSVAAVLDMTTTEALAFFADDHAVQRALEPLAAVGLGYLKLGQPVPTLSGGEAQRLKLAGHLARAGTRAAAGILFLFDEPTTGLHFDDVATLLGAFEQLVAAGHSLIVIEHDLDVVRAADWVIDLGPEGGDGGGDLVYAGPADGLTRCPASRTGEALRAASARAPSRRRPGARRRRATRRDITIHNAREHNLRGVDVTIPSGRLTVITGVSGSGKSTVAFDILFAEGQRRYLESINAYARQFVQPAARPDVDAVAGIPPTVAIEQRTSRGGRKSTVATMTEVHHFLRLLFVRLGTQHCPRCDVPIDAQSPESVLARIVRTFRGRRVTLHAPLVVARKGYYTDLARWAASKGFATLRVDGRATPTAEWPRLDRFREHDIDLPVGDLVVGPHQEAALGELLARTITLGRGRVRVSAAARRQTRERLFSVRRACPSCGISFDEPDPRLFSFNSRHGWCPACFGTGREIAEFGEEDSGEETVWLDASHAPGRTCRACNGRRLRPEALAVRFARRSIADFAELTVSRARRALAAVRLGEREMDVARDVLAELDARLGFLERVGLDYLTLARAAPTLSGGEAQRIRLAAQLGSNLQGVCYVLDEPTIGLHPRDNARLLDTLVALRERGNTLVVVEHDEETVRRADHVIDLGPGAGTEGGLVVAAGPLERLRADRASVTGRYLAEPLLHPLRPRRAVARAGRSRRPASEVLTVSGADLHNLRRIDARVPLARLVCVTGVSGSGKSTLVRDVLHDGLRARLAARRGSRARPVGCTAIDGAEGLARVLEVDQTPIGKTPRSCPATYVGLWDAVRRLFAETPEARVRGYGPPRFSFNVAGGRCDTCDGQGVRRIAMSFLPDVEMPCEACAGMRFNVETLGGLYRGANIGDVLSMSVAQARTFFQAHRRVHHTLTLLDEVGLGYLTLGQRSPTLSGGEAQRIKLVAELAKAAPETPMARAPRHTLYVLDEPTVGLHMADVEKLLRVLHRLVDAGHSVVVIEHNLDVIAEADWVIDLGPEGGEAGGRIVAQGTPEEVSRVTRSHTARFLAPFLAERAAPIASGARGVKG
jgi:excinuclease ABC subunit A